MRKIKDPVVLGVVAGLAGNLLKNIGNTVNIKLGITQTSYPRISGGFFMKKNTVESIYGKTAGWIADTVIAGGLGVGLVYLLKMTGKDHALIKGAIYGQTAWTTLFGVAGKLGASNIYPTDAKTVLSGYMNHNLYGIGAALAATALGDEDLFRKEDIDLKEKIELEEGPRKLRIVPK